MTLQTPELQTVCDRLAKMERQNRRLRWLVAAGFLLPAAVFVANQIRMNGRIEAREFALRDASGVVRARLAVSDGEPRLMLLDSQENVRAVFAPRALAPAAALPANDKELAPRQSSEPRLARAGFRTQPWPGTSQAASSVGLVIWSALHPLLPRLAGLDGESSNSSGNLAPERFAASLPRNDATADFATASPQASTPGDSELASNASPVERRVSRESRSPHLDTSLPHPPAGLPLIKWAQARSPQTAPGPRVARNPFEFAGQPGGEPRPLGSVPVAPAASLPAAPPVTLKAMGYAESAGSTPQAIISDDVNIYVVHAGDSFAGRFQVVTIDPSGVDIDDRLAGRSLRLAFNP